MSYSMFYGKRRSANAFPLYSTADLKRDLTSPSLDDDTRAKIEAEIVRRDEAKIVRRAEKAALKKGERQ